MRPAPGGEARCLCVGGQLHEPAQWRLEQIRAWPSTSLMLDRSAPPLPGRRLRGLATRELLARLRPERDACFVLAHGADGRHAGFPLASFAAAGALIVYEAEGRLLDDQQGGPLCLLVPVRGGPSIVPALSHLELLNKPWPP